MFSRVIQGNLCLSPTWFVHHASENSVPPSRFDFRGLGSGDIQHSACHSVFIHVLVFVHSVGYLEHPVVI